MRRTGLLITIATALMAFSTGAQEALHASGAFVGKNGQPAGSAELTQTSAGVLIEIEVNGLPGGQWVAFHVHETGSCDPATGHDSAGGHFNPESSEHGYLAGGPHAGDMPNQYVDTDGTLRAQIFNSFIQLEEGANSVSGRALMIHAAADDYQSQPSGNAGERLACAVIE